jgi:DNA mismatch endonuclease (patch repair protein)
MVDIVDSATRTRMMSGIRSKNTKPELLIRSLLHRRGFRFRLHGSALEGKPDLVFHRRRAVIFINGCFWHGHDCPLFKWPATRPEFWRTKIGRNQTNDRRAIEALMAAGWRVGVVWECAIRGRDRDVDGVIDRLSAWLLSDDHFIEERFRSV